MTFGHQKELVVIIEVNDRISSHLMSLFVSPPASVHPENETPQCTEIAISRDESSGQTEYDSLSPSKDGVMSSKMRRFPEKGLTRVVPTKQRGG